MSDESFTDVTEGLGSRIIGSIKGILFGLVMIAVSVILLFWNEGRAVRTAEMLSEGAAEVISIEADKVDPANEGRLVHLTGGVITSAPLADPQFGVSISALRLRRKVETYQWVERSETTTEKKLGGGEEKRTTYTYSKAWSEPLIDSSHFNSPEGHLNPAATRFAGQSWMAKDAKLGAFAIPDRILGRLSNFEAVPATESTLSAELKAGAVVQGGDVYFAANPKTQPNSSAPSVGDTRVSFAVVKPGVISAVSRQAGKTLEPYPTKSGKDLELVESGTASAAAMFKQAEDSNATLNWILRAVGFFLSFLGFFLLLRPLAVVADVVPFIGSLVGFGAGLAALVVGSMLSLIVVAVSWIGHRPILGGALLAVAVAIFVGGKMLAGGKKQSQPTTA